MRVTIAGLLAGIAGALSAPSAQAQDAQVVTRPDWRERPSAEDMAEAYPPIAYELQIPGRAMLACELDDRGALQTCEVTGEAPKGLGFGRAALQLAPTFRMEPLRIANQPVAGGAVRIPISFKLPPSEPVTIRPASDEALALARRYVDAGDRAAVMEADREVVAEMIEVLPPAFAPREITAAAGAALRDATRALHDELRDVLARLYAAKYSKAALARMARKPGGGDWDSVMDDLSDAYNTSLAMRAGDIFCAKRACAEGRPPPIPLAASER